MVTGDEGGLIAIGLTGGDRVRFRRPSGGWAEARVEGRERDGSVRLRDGKGAARAIPVDRLEVRTTGPRGGHRWEPLEDLAARTEQLRLL
jgi:hypothetical protein